MKHCVRIDIYMYIYAFICEWCGGNKNTKGKCQNLID